MTFNGFYLLNWKHFSLSNLKVGVPTYPLTLALTSVLGILFFTSQVFSFFNTSAFLTSHEVYAFICLYFFNSQTCIYYFADGQS